MLQQYIPERAQGSYVWTSDGRKHLDMSTGEGTCQPYTPTASTSLQQHTLFAGIGVVSTGHCHPKVVKAIQDQAANMIMAQQNVFLASKPMVGASLVAAVQGTRHNAGPCQELVDA